MSFWVSKPDPPSRNNCGGGDDEHEEVEQGTVSSHLFIKPAHSAGTLDKEVVLRRIRHRKRVNKIKNAVQSLLSSPFSPPPPSTVHNKRWVDDAFAAL